MPRDAGALSGLVMGPGAASTAAPARAGASYRIPAIDDRGVPPWVGPGENLSSALVQHGTPHAPSRIRVCQASPCAARRAPGSERACITCARPMPQTDKLVHEVYAVVSELITNAVRYGATEGVVTCHLADGYLEGAVADNGGGMAWTARRLAHRHTAPLHTRRVPAGDDRRRRADPGRQTSLGHACSRPTVHRTGAVGR
jgi:hypothetical protein